jgi:hypothetical protein
MRPLTAALAACSAISVLSACVEDCQKPPEDTTRTTSIAGTAPILLPETFQHANLVCHRSDGAGGPPAGDAADSQAHGHPSIERWNHVPKATWFKFFPRGGSTSKFFPKVSADADVQLADPFNEMELLDFRLVNRAQSLITLEMDGVSAQKFCDNEPAPTVPVPFFDGPFLLAVEPLQNNNQGSISEHVMVYAPLKVNTSDAGPLRDWYVFLTWHVRTAEECSAVQAQDERDSCEAVRVIAALDPSDYDTMAVEQFRKVKFPVDLTSTSQMHNGVIHGTNGGG